MKEIATTVLKKIYSLFNYDADGETPNVELILNDIL